MMAKPRLSRENAKPVTKFMASWLKGLLSFSLLNLIKTTE